VKYLNLHSSFGVQTLKGVVTIRARRDDCFDPGLFKSLDVRVGARIEFIFKAHLVGAAGTARFTIAQKTEINSIIQQQFRGEPGLFYKPLLIAVFAAREKGDFSFFPEEIFQAQPIRPVGSVRLFLPDQHGFFLRKGFHDGFLFGKDFAAFDGIRFQGNVMIKGFKVVTTHLTCDIAGAARGTIVNHVHHIFRILCIIIQDDLSQSEAPLGTVRSKIEVAHAWAILAEAHTLNFIKRDPFAAKTIAATIHHWSEIL
jgi:hypothetical protein